MLGRNEWVKIIAAAFAAGFVGSLAAIHLGLADDQIDEVASWYDQSGEMESLKDDSEKADEELEARIEAVERHLNLIP